MRNKSSQYFAERFWGGRVEKITLSKKKSDASIKKG